ncbi:MAG: ATP-binding cassette domain-containing protein [Myxococcota bacterium]
MPGHRRLESDAAAWRRAARSGRGRLVREGKRARSTRRTSSLRPPTTTSSARTPCSRRRSPPPGHAPPADGARALRHRSGAGSGPPPWRSPPSRGVHRGLAAGAAVAHRRVRRPARTVEHGLALVGALLALQLGVAVAGKHQWSEAWKTAHAINLLLRVAGFRKVLRMAPSARRREDGELATLFGSDTARIGQLAFVHLAWSAPLAVAGSCAALFAVLGWAALAPLAMMLVGFGLALWLNTRLFRLAPQLRDADAARLDLIGEVVAGIRVIKQLGWEGLFERRVDEARGRFRDLLVRRQRVLAALLFVDAGLPIAMAAGGLLAFVALGHALTAADIFASIAMLAVLRVQVPEILRIADIVSSARASTRKFVGLLDEPDAEPRPSSVPAGAIRVRGACLGDQLRSVDLAIEPGELVAVVGPVGSGKSSLLAAIAGDIALDAGTVEVGGAVASAPHVPWLVSAPIVDNLRTFSAASDERYREVLSACALEVDLAALPAGDRSELAERGTNLSGGQRQRVGLARAALLEASTVLLDDPLSAVDPAVGARVGEQLIDGILADRTRVIATHDGALAARCDRVVVMDAGRVVEAGAPRELLARDSAFAAFHRRASTARAEQRDAAPAPTSDAAGEFVVPEELGVRAFGASLRDYVGRLAPGGSIGLLLVLFVATEAAAAALSVWIGVWTANPAGAAAWYAGVFVAIALVALVLDRARFLVAFDRGVVAGMDLHRGMIRALLSARTTFFDQNPSGRVLSRLGADLETIDLELARDATNYLYVATGAVVAAIVLVAANPPAVLVVIPAAVLVARWQRQARSSTVAVARIAKGLKGPLLTQVAEAARGGSVVRASPAGAAWLDRRFVAAATLARDADYTLNSLSRYFNILLDYLGTTLIVASGLFLVADPLATGPRAGVAFAFAMAVTGNLRAVLFAQRTLEVSLAALDRASTLLAAPGEPSGGRCAPAAWPEVGRIELEGVSMRYRADLPEVLRDVSFEVPGGARIALVGRTGSGKSSVLQALMRFVEVERGRIRIDGQDTAELALSDLRRAIAVVPQEPFLFAGTLRSNLDPEGQEPDESLLDVVRRAQLADRIDSLEAPVEAGGRNLSAGERQLVCLARAMVRRARIVLLDEATANLDPETEDRIRAAMAGLHGATVVAIAHRPQTARAADRIVTLDSGSVRPDDALATAS